MKIQRFWFPVLINFAIIFLVSSIPNIHAPERLPGLDKVVHFMLYSPLGLLMTRALMRAWPSMSKRRVFGIAFLFCVLYGISDELHQIFVPGRDCDYHDVLADALGSFVGGMIYLRCRK